MEVIATGKYISISPKKARPVADLIRGKKAVESVAVLGHLPQASAKEVLKVLKSAIANAENNFNLEPAELDIAKITINSGPVLKRYQPRSKGMATSIKRRTSHIEIVVSGEIKTKATKEKKAAEQKTNFNQEEQEHKIEMDRSEQKKIYTTTPKEMGKKMFRRKTG